MLGLKGGEIPLFKSVLRPLLSKRFTPCTVRYAFSHLLTFLPSFISLLSSILSPLRATAKLEERRRVLRPLRAAATCGVVARRAKPQARRAKTGHLTSDLPTKQLTPETFCLHPGPHIPRVIWRAKMHVCRNHLTFNFYLIVAGQNPVLGNAAIISQIPHAHRAS